MDNDFLKILLKKTKKAYGTDYMAHCLEIYKMYVERTDAISERRESANTFFLSINTALIGLIGYLDQSEKCTKLAIGIAGVILCYFWYRLLLSYKGLNSAKFKVVHAIEKQLPLSPYDAEWEILKRGMEPNLYKPFTHIEIWVPRVFLILHLIAMIIAYWKEIVALV